jgi:hypothetical protein
VSPADDRPGNMSPSAYLSTLAPKLLRLQSLRQQPFAPRAGDLYMRWEPSQTAGLQNLQRLVSNWKGAQLKQELGNVLYQLHLVSSLPLTMSTCQSRLVKSVEWSHFGATKQCSTQLFHPKPAHCAVLATSASSMDMIMMMKVLCSTTTASLSLHSFGAQLGLIAWCCCASVHQIRRYSPGHCFAGVQAQAHPLPPSVGGGGVSGQLAADVHKHQPGAEVAHKLAGRRAGMHHRAVNAGNTCGVLDLLTASDQGRFPASISVCAGMPAKLVLMPKCSCRHDKAVVSH